MPRIMRIVHASAEPDDIFVEEVLDLLTGQILGAPGHQLGKEAGRLGESLASFQRCRTAASFAGEPTRCGFFWEGTRASFRRSGQAAAIGPRCAIGDDSVVSLAIALI